MTAPEDLKLKSLKALHEFIHYPSQQGQAGPWTQSTLVRKYNRVGEVTLEYASYAFTRIWLVKLSTKNLDKNSAKPDGLIEGFQVHSISLQPVMV